MVSPFIRFCNGLLGDRIFILHIDTLALFLEMSERAVISLSKRGITFTTINTKYQKDSNVASKIMIYLPDMLL